MNSRKTIALLILFMAASAPGNLSATDQLSDSDSQEQTNGDRGLSQPDLDQLEPLLDKERSGIWNPEADIQAELGQRSQVLEETVNNETSRLKGGEQQADILEELLLE